MSNAALYERVWQHDAYRVVAPGEHHVTKFLELARPHAGATVADFGAGTGRGAARIALLSQTSVCAVDFAANCLDDGVLGERVRFLQHDLTQPLGERFDFGFCTDVLEHIDPANVDKVLTHIGTSARRVYLAISTVDDVMGALVGEPLHLTVESPYWWHDKLTELGYRVDWSHEQEGVVCFWASMYMDGEDFADRSVLNIEMDAARENIRRNLLLRLQEVQPHSTQDTTVYLLAGGPSLADFEQQIIEAGKAGTPIVCVNGTYGWLLERGIRPAAMVMVDARPMNRRFITKVVDTCKYLLSSQCDHELVASLPPEQTWLWHSAESAMITEVAQEAGIPLEWFPVPGGSTVLLRSLPLLAMLGFRNVEVFGWDSCLRGDEHHAYAQPENDSRCVVTMNVGKREFKCHPWMALQAYEFERVVKNVLSKISDFNLIVHGDGLISSMMQHAAESVATEV